MRKILIPFLLLTLVSASFAQAPSIGKLSTITVTSAAQQPSKAKPKTGTQRTMAVVEFVPKHPVRSIKGIFYGALHVVGMGVDVVEKVTGTVAKGASKVDTAIDAAEDASNPAK